MPSSGKSMLLQIFNVIWALEYQRSVDSDLIWHSFFFWTGLPLPPHRLTCRPQESADSCWAPQLDCCSICTFRHLLQVEGKQNACRREAAVSPQSSCAGAATPPPSAPSPFILPFTCHCTEFIIFFTPTSHRAASIIVYFYIAWGYC